MFKEILLVVNIVIFPF